MASINATTSSGIVATADNTGQLQLQTTGTTAVTIDTSQNVGIGNTNPQAKLDVGSGIINRGSPGAACFSWFGDIATANWTSTLGGYNLTFLNDNSSGNLGTGTVSANSTTFYPKVQFTTGGGCNLAGRLSISQTPANYTIDVTGGATVVANGGTVDFSSCSGMLVVNSWSTGGVSIYLFGGGGTAIIGSVIGAVGTTAYNAGVNGYRWTNNSGSSATFGFFFIRTRTGA